LERMLILEKMSVPGWQFKSDYIEHLLNMLEHCVCDACKVTEAQYRQATLTVDAEYEQDYSDFKPEAYDQYSPTEKIHWLLSTTCGCEYDFYDEAEESDLTSVEIGVDSQG
jgi:hypothetical protein